jgi:hypothetical protein
MIAYENVYTGLMRFTFSGSHPDTNDHGAISFAAIFFYGAVPGIYPFIKDKKPWERFCGFCTGTLYWEYLFPYGCAICQYCDCIHHYGNGSIMIWFRNLGPQRKWTGNRSGAALSVGGVTLFFI